MRIYGIDASLKSTGVCAVDVKFEEHHATTLMELLLDIWDGHVSKEQADEFNEAIEIVTINQIAPPREIEKQLAKIRKRVRDDIKVGQPSNSDLAEVEKLLADRIKHQVHEIVELHDRIEPTLTMIEDYSFHSQGSLVQLAEMKGYLKGYHVPTILTAPITSVKKVGSTKGNGNKAAMYAGIQRFPFYDIDLDESRDDEIDALAICLSAFYAIYDRTIGIPLPKGENSKEKTKIKSWKKCLKTFADHIGNSVEMKGMIDGVQS